VERADAAQQHLWSFLLYEEGGLVYPGTLMRLGKAVAPTLQPDAAVGKQAEDEGVKVVAAVALFFDGRSKLTLDEWMLTCHNSQQVYTTRLKHQTLTTGMGLFPELTRRVEQLRQHAANFSCQGRLWYGRQQLKVRVENGYLSTVPVSKEKEVQGFTDSYRLVDTAVVPDTRHRSRFEVLLQDGRRLRFDAGSEASAKQWVNAILTNVAPSNSSFRFDSFARRRDNVDVKWYVDGKDYFADLLLVLRAATTEILITDWSMSPEIYLEREQGDVGARLDLVLIAKANAGVKVHIMLWWQSNVAVQGTVNANYVQRRFKDVPNIAVLLHPSGTFPAKWSHHQKSVIVDRAVGFCGGLDLCYGRYDDRRHGLSDSCHLRTRFPGKDFYNPGISACDNLHVPWEEKLDRLAHPREPWHDIQVGANRGCAADLARNFVQRWNHHVKETGMLLPAMAPVEPGETDVMPERFEFWRKSATEVKTAQVLRSLSKWSGNHATEQSIYKGYLYAIEHAEHFIYIENQFFISSQGPVQNKIAEALVRRVIRAISEKSRFLVVIVLPFHPEGSFDATSTRILYRFGFKTVRYMRRELERAHPLSKFSDHFQFGSPIQHERIGDRFFLQIIYVHSKLMIVDDRIVICGSANINDRSMLGDRDSELAMYIEGKLDRVSKMDGKDFMVSQFAHSLRVSLWIEHLGLPPRFEYAAEDPCSDVAFDFWTGIGEFNEHVLKPIVDITPADLYAIVGTGVPSQVKRHRVIAPNLKLRKELRELLHERADGGESSDEEEEEQRPEAVATAPPVLNVVTADQVFDKGKEEADAVEGSSGSKQLEAAEAIELSGWLEKPRLDSLGKTVLQPFFCELSTSRLSLREGMGSAQLSDEIAVTATMHVAEYDGAPFGFSLVDDDGVTHFSAESDGEKHRWIEALRRVLSVARRRVMQRGGVGRGTVQGICKDGKLLDTARSFLAMDGVVHGDARVRSQRIDSNAHSLGSPRVISLEEGTPRESSGNEARAAVDVESSYEDEYSDEEQGEMSEASHGGGNNNNVEGGNVTFARQSNGARSRRRRKVKEAVDKTKGALDKTTEAMHHAVVQVGEGFEDAGHAVKSEAERLADRAKRFFKIFTHTGVERRLRRVQGHLVPYPVGYVPRIPADLYAAAPTDIFT
jgi:phosphatidylserine/phosphatidylglycerophosphate/cardiolipin synthase-like enzyme